MISPAAAALLLIKTYAFLLRKQPFFASMVRVVVLLISKEKEEVEAELADDRDESQTIWHVTSKPLIITFYYLLLGDYCVRHSISHHVPTTFRKEYFCTTLPFFFLP